MPPRVKAALTSPLDPPRNPVHVTVATWKWPVEGEAPRVRQMAYSVVPRAHKMAALGRILGVEEPPSVMVYCRTRKRSGHPGRDAAETGGIGWPLTGGFSQISGRVMKAFRAGKTDILVATDVAGQGAGHRPT